jgi:hypothetical protein
MIPPQAPQLLAPQLNPTEQAAFDYHIRSFNNQIRRWKHLRKADRGGDNVFRAVSAALHNNQKYHGYYRGLALQYMEADADFASTVGFTTPERLNRVKSRLLISEDSTHELQALATDMNLRLYLHRLGFEPQLLTPKCQGGELHIAIHTAQNNEFPMHFSGMCDHDPNYNSASNSRTNSPLPVPPRSSSPAPYQSNPSNSWHNQRPGGQHFY